MRLPDWFRSKRRVLPHHPASQEPTSPQQPAGRPEPDPITAALERNDREELNDLVLRSLKPLEWYQAIIRDHGDRLVHSLIELVQRRDLPHEILDCARTAIMFDLPSSTPLDPLIRALESPDLRMRECAVTALGKIRNPNALPHLLRVFEDKRDPTRWEALNALAEDLWSRAGLHAEILEALRKNPNAVLALLDYVEKACAFTSVSPFEDVAEILAALDEKRAIPALERHLCDPYHSMVHKAAARTLAKLGWQPGSTELQITNAIANQDWATLRRFGSHAEEFLIKALHEGTVQVDSVLSALAELGTERAQREVLSALRSGTAQAKTARNALNGGRAKEDR